MNKLRFFLKYRIDRQVVIGAFTLIMFAIGMFFFVLNTGKEQERLLEICLKAGLPEVMHSKGQPYCQGVQDGNSVWIPVAELEGK